MKKLVPLRDSLPQNVLQSIDSLISVLKTSPSDVREKAFEEFSRQYSLLAGPQTPKTSKHYSPFKTPKTPVSKESMQAVFNNTIEFQGVTYGLDLLDGAIYKVGLLQVEHAQSKHEIQARIEDEFVTLLANNDSFCEWLTQYNGISARWGLKKEVDSFIETIYQDYRKSISRQDRKGIDKFDLALQILKENQDEIIKNTNFDALKGAYFNYLTHEMSNLWLLNSWDNQQKSGQDFFAWITDCLKNNEDDLSSLHAQSVMEYLYFYFREANQGSKLNFDQFSERINKGIQDQSIDKVDVIKDLFSIKGSLIEIQGKGSKKYGLGDSMERWFIKQHSVKVKLAQFLHMYKLKISNFVETLYERANSHPDEVIKGDLRQILVQVLSELDKNQDTVFNKYVSKIEEIDPVFASRLMKYNQSELLLTSPISQVQHKSTLNEMMRSVILSFDD